MVGKYGRTATVLVWALGVQSGAFSLSSPTPAGLRSAAYQEGGSNAAARSLVPRAGPRYRRCMSEDEADDLLWSLGAAVEAGVLALNALSRGEAIDPDALDRLADALHIIATDPRVTGPPVVVEEVARVRRLRNLVGPGVPSSEVQALAEECRRALVQSDLPG